MTVLFFCLFRLILLAQRCPSTSEGLEQPDGVRCYLSVTDCAGLGQHQKGSLCVYDIVEIREAVPVLVVCDLERCLRGILLPLQGLVPLSLFHSGRQGIPYLRDRIEDRLFVRRQVLLLPCRLDFDVAADGPSVEYRPSYLRTE